MKVFSRAALERARASNVETAIIEHAAFRDRRTFDAKVVETLRSYGVDLVVLAGFMRLVTDVLLDAFAVRLTDGYAAAAPALARALQLLLTVKVADDEGDRANTIPDSYVRGEQARMARAVLMAMEPELTAAGYAEAA